MQFVLRSRRLGAATLSVTVFGAAAVTVAAAFPTVAQGAVVAVTSVTCSVTGSSWCISGNNSSSGIGVIGTSKSGTGLRGSSTSQYGLKATSGSSVAIYAQTTSGSSAITALGSSKGNGVNASAGGAGLSGTSTGSGQGVLGYSKSGTGVYGLSSTENGGEFISTSGNGVYAETAGLNGAAVYGNGTGNATGGEFHGGTTGIVGFAPTIEQILELYTSDGSQSKVFAVDGQGNVYYRGTLQSFARTARGGTARSFSANSTRPTVEDTGTAQLVRGAAAVRLDPAFAASIEPATGYRVFVTPDGETNGLFVADKTAAGFIVRESHAGRSTVTFDYRIVATKLGAAGQRMAILSPADARALTHAPPPALPPAKLGASLPARVVEPSTP